MTAPTFIQEAEVVWNANTTPKTSASFSVQTGDVLVAYLLCEDAEGAPAWDGAITGGSLTWAEPQQVQVSMYVYVLVATTTATSTTAMTVSFARSAGTTSRFYGGNVLTFRGSDGIGASSKTNVASGAPSLNLTTTAADSAIVVANGDWTAADGASRTWRTTAGAFTEQSYFRDAARYVVYGGYHANVGAVGVKNVGLSAPAAQKYSIVAVEVKGTGAAAGPSVKLNSLMMMGIGR
jgi:hypothetical protein